LRFDISLEGASTPMPSWVTYTPENNHQLTFSPTKEDVGAHTFSLRVRDASGEVLDAEFDLEVRFDESKKDSGNNDGLVIGLSVGLSLSLVTGVLVVLFLRKRLSDTRKHTVPVSRRLNGLVPPVNPNGAPAANQQAVLAPPPPPQLTSPPVQPLPQPQTAMVNNPAYVGQNGASGGSAAARYDTADAHPQIYATVDDDQGSGLAFVPRGAFGAA
jgi:hypothetical protein